MNEILAQIVEQYGDNGVLIVPKTVMHPNERVEIVECFDHVRVRLNMPEYAEPER